MRPPLFHPDAVPDRNPGIVPAHHQRLVAALAWSGLALTIAFAVGSDRLMRHVAAADSSTQARVHGTVGAAPSTFGAGTHRKPWLIAVTGFSAVVFVVFWLASGHVQRWLDRAVARPLVGLADWTDATWDGESDPRADRDAPALSEACAELQELGGRIIEARSRNRRTHRETLRQIREKEAGFDRVLRRAEDRATTDVLTGLRNRSFLTTELPGIVTRQKQSGQDLAAVMLDVDNFKRHNDTHGHHAGDELLRFAGELLSGSIRPSDFAIRYAGDEFLLLLVGVGQRQAATIVQRIVRLFAQYTATLRSAAPPSLSAGVATLKELPEAGGAELIAAADRALYAAKRKGKNAVAIGSRPTAGAIECS